MSTQHYRGRLKTFIDRACSGTSGDIDFIMEHLTMHSSFAMTRVVDYALSWVDSTEGEARIKHYLFSGTLIQRNYASLYFNRRGDWKYVKEAFEQGLIDELQAYSR